MKYVEYIFVTEKEDGTIATVDRAWCTSRHDSWKLVNGGSRSLSSEELKLIVSFSTAFQDPGRPPNYEFAPYGVVPQVGI